MTLHQLIYRSKKSQWVGSAEVRSIIERSSTINKNMSISGTLLFDGEYFLQVLEGSQSEVLECLCRIQADPAHSQLVILLDETVDEREFGTPGMQLIESQTGIVSKLEDGLSNLSIFIRMLDNPGMKSKANMIIKAFRKGRWNICDELISIKKSAPPPQKTCVRKSIVERSYPHYFAFQPIVDVNLMKVTCVEALIRGFGGTPPYTVLNDLEPEALFKLDVESKLSALSMVGEMGFEGSIALNLLPMSLVSYQGSVELIAKHAKSLGISPRRLVIEVTEDQAIENLDVFMEAIKTARHAGMRLSIDDFGAGYAGLSLLADFQPHKIKIDRKIVDNIKGNGPRQAIVKSVIEFSERLGIEVVAEGVEDESDLAWLFAAGIRNFQGYYFSRPAYMSLHEVNWPDFLVEDIDWVSQKVEA
ncbi:MAG: diguanylate phosphodiesterase [Saccharospirillum sp.]|uniref:diguanylate phosphodiesterase n=1 Tax=Saccharospirillum sp. TaxID=2033801 RepID=UPI0032977D5E